MAEKYLGYGTCIFGYFTKNCEHKAENKDLKNWELGKVGKSEIEEGIV